MTLGASVANRLWLLSGRGSAQQFARALGNPEETQREWLRRTLAADATGRFGEAHDFGALRDPAQFARCVPMSTYDDVAPWIERIRRGARDVLAVGPVTHLAPTSGSTGGRKLIPFTSGLQRGFDAAVSAWMHDLARQRPAMLGGPSYWSISPLADEDAAADASSGSAVRIGHADDADYLGAAAAWLVRHAMAAPSSLRHVRDVQAFWRLTALALLRQRSLRLISIWHPSFLDLLVTAIQDTWEELLDAIASGRCPWIEALPADARGGWTRAGDASRAAELRREGREDWLRWWPSLQVVSSWGEQGAEAGWQSIARAVAERQPHVLVQPKGLLATEGVVTIPFAETHCLAITSHFFEFLDEAGDARLAHQLERGKRYEVVLTNGGGLWRYRLGDVVECTGWCRATPTLRFLGRAGRVSDLRGEKLSEVFVSQVLREAWSGDRPADYIALRAWRNETRAGYDLLLASPDEHLSVETVATRVEAALSANPHYALARRLGQLQAVRGVVVDRRTALADLQSHHGRLGDAKPRILLTVDRETGVSAATATGTAS